MRQERREVKNLVSILLEKRGRIRAMAESEDRKTRFDGEEFKRLMLLAGPLLAANLAQVGMGVVDTLVAGRAGMVDMAGAALGSSVATPVLLAGSGLLSILGPIISRLRGEGRDARVGYVVRNGLFVSLILAALAIVVLWFARSGFALLTDDLHMASIASDYVLAILWGVPAFMGYCVFRSLHEGFALTRAVMIVGLGGLACNIPANFAFVFGWWGLPAMGGAGCGAATALIFWVELALMILLVRRSRRLAEHRRRLAAWRPPAWQTVVQIVKLGGPLGISLLCEVSFFTVASLVLAVYGAGVVAAQQVSVNVSSLFFMLPLSTAVAASIRMGYFVGRRDAASMDTLARTGLVVTLGISLFSMAAIILFRYDMIACYTSDPGVTSIAQGLLVLCAVYQCPDSIQAFMGGLLRGCHDTAIISRLNLVTYWLLGFPLCLLLVRTDWVVKNMGASGAWVSFIVTLFAMSVLLSMRYRKTRRNLQTAWRSASGE